MSLVHQNVVLCGNGLIVYVIGGSKTGSNRTCIIQIHNTEGNFFAKKDQNFILNEHHL